MVPMATITPPLTPVSANELAQGGIIDDVLISDCFEFGGHQ